MGKAKRLKKLKGLGNLGQVGGISSGNEIKPISNDKLLDGYSYWVTGYFWEHDTVIVEPFLANYLHGVWEVTNLSRMDISYYHAKKIVSGSGTMLVFEDRVTALDACDALDNEMVLMESFSSYMSENEIVQYVEGKGK